MIMATAIKAIPTLYGEEAIRLRNVRKKLSASLSLSLQ